SRDAVRKRRLLYIGAAMGLLPVALAIARDPAIWPWLAGATLAFAAFVLLGWRLGILQTADDGGHPFHPAELDHRSYTGAHLHSGGAHDEFSRSVVLSISVAVLLSALVGALFSVADTRARQAALDAVGFETDMLKRGSHLNALTRVVVDDLAQA